MMALAMGKAELEMCGAAAYLAELPGVKGPDVGAIGFCLGGGLAVWAAATCPQITAAVSYYYVMPHGKPDFTKLKGPVLGHFGTADAFIPQATAEGARGGDPRCGCRRHVPLLPRRRARLLQRHQPPRHLRRRGQGHVLGALGELPAQRARLRSAPVLAAALASATGVMGIAGAGAAQIVPRTPSWSAPATLGGCAGSEAPWAVFPEDSPGHATGPGAVVFSTAGGCPGGARVLVAAIGAGARPATPAALRTASGRALALRGPLVVARGPRGGVVLAASASGSASPGGSPRGPVHPGPRERPLLATELNRRAGCAVASASAYLGDVAIASTVAEPRGRSAVRLRLERHRARAFEPARPVSRAAAGAIASLTVALDYRSDALVAWSQRGAIYARELPASGRAHPIQRLGAAGTDMRIAAVISDDNRAIVAWAEQRASQTSIYLDRSTARVRFHRAVLLEHFADPDGLRSPGASPSLIRLSSESVMLAWSGSRAGHWVVRTAPIDLNGMRAVQTMPTQGADALLAGLAPGPADDAFALWTEPQPSRAGDAGPGQSAIFAARGVETYPGVSTFGAPEQIARTGTQQRPRDRGRPELGPRAGAVEGSGRADRVRDPRARGTLSARECEGADSARSGF